MSLWSSALDYYNHLDFWVRSHVYVRLLVSANALFFASVLLDWRAVRANFWEAIREKVGLSLFTAFAGMSAFSLFDHTLAQLVEREPLFFAIGTLAALGVEARALFGFSRRGFWSLS